MTSSKPRLYRFGQRDRTGWLLGFQAAQCLPLGVGILVGGLLLNAGVPVPAVFAPVVMSSLFAFGRWNGHPLHEHVPVMLGWGAASATGTNRWAAEPRRFRHPLPNSPVTQPELPPVLAGQTIDESAHAGWTRRGRDVGAAVIRDRRERSISAVLRVHGREFSLCERDEQERLLQLWGDALAAFCAERGPVGRIRWIEWAAPAGLEDQLTYLAEHHNPNDSDEPVAAYRELLDHAGPMATRHEVLVVVTVEDRRLRLRPKADRDRASAAEEALMEEVRLMATRLDAAGLVVDAPLSPSEVAHAWRSRLDPYHAPGVRSGRRRSLVELAGLVSVANAGPLSIHAERDHVRVDSAVHAAYVIAEWPRLDVPPAWMEPLLLHAGGIRTVAVHYEPVAPSRSRRAIDRDTVKLASDEEQRTRSGFRIGARHRRAQADVLEREAELVAGYAEFEFVGFVVVTASDVDELERSCAEYEQVAAQSGLELRRLDGRHDLALACVLPMGRGIAPRRFA